MVMATEVRPKHAKCGHYLVRRSGEWYCTNCWVTVELPTIAPEEAQEEVEPGPGRVRQRDATPGSPSWTEEERKTWATWKEGDPIPGERQMEPEADGIRVLDTRRLGASCIESLRYLAEQKALLDVKSAKIAEEAGKLVAIARQCGAMVPVDLERLSKGTVVSRPATRRGPIQKKDTPCGCGQMFQTGQARALHRRRDNCHVPVSVPA